MKKITKETKLSGDVVLYRDKSGPAVEVKLDNETIWLSLNQIAELFSVQKAAISKHLKNIYDSGELQRKSTVSILETVQTEGKRQIKRQIEFYNLDAIISVGYRVNSKQATEFRIWATRTLREYLVKGYVLNQKRLRESTENSVKELQKTLGFIQETIKRKQLDQSEADSLLSVIRGYADSWLLLQQYDERSVVVQKGKAKERKRFGYDFVRKAIDVLAGDLRKRKEASDLFGNERDRSFGGILQAIYQTFGGKELYASLEEKAAHLLYFIIKDHPFSDGNKRIGSFLFVLFLDRNGMLYRKNGEKKINDTTLVALALLVAESDPKEKEQMIALITQLLK